jgi:hypothetical protein
MEPSQRDDPAVQAAMARAAAATPAGVARLSELSGEPLPVS